MSDFWWLVALLLGLLLVILAAVVGVVMLFARDVPDEMPDRWRRENERDRGKS